MTPDFSTFNEREISRLKLEADGYREYILSMQQWVYKNSKHGSLHAFDKLSLHLYQVRTELEKLMVLK